MNENYIILLKSLYSEFPSAVENILWSHSLYITERRKTKKHLFNDLILCIKCSIDNFILWRKRSCNELILCQKRYFNNRILYRRHFLTILFCKGNFSFFFNHSILCRKRSSNNLILRRKFLIIIFCTGNVLLTILFCAGYFNLTKSFCTILFCTTNATVILEAEKNTTMDLLLEVKFSNYQWHCTMTAVTSKILTHNWLPMQSK